MKKNSCYLLLFLIILFIFVFAIVGSCQAQPPSGKVLPQKDWVEFNKHLKSTQKALEQVDADLIKAEQQVFNAFRNGTKETLDSAEINYRMAVKNWENFYFDRKETDSAIILKRKR